MATSDLAVALADDEDLVLSIEMVSALAVAAADPDNEFHALALDLIEHGPQE